MIKRLAVLSFGVGVLAVMGALMATDPGEITAAPKVGVTPTYVDQLEAEAERTGRQVVWTGPGIDFGDSAILFESIPVLMDIEDVGKSLASIKNENTRREVQAIDMRLKHQFQHPTAAEQFARNGLREFYSEAEAAAKAGNLKHLSLHEQVLFLERALRARDDEDTLVQQFAEAAIDPIQYKVPGTDCDYGTVCPGCYTEIGRHGRLRFCSAACIGCVARPRP